MTLRSAPRLILAADAVVSGDDDRRLARECAAGRLVRVSRGAYLAADTWAGLDPRQRQLLRAVAAARTRRRDDLLLSHESAGLAWGLPTWGWPAGPVELLQPGTGRDRSTPELRVRVAAVAPDEVQFVDGLALTTLRRTVIDLLVTRSRLQAVVLVDHLLRKELFSRRDLGDLVAARPTARNRRRAEWAVTFGHPGGESPGESASRVLAHDAGFVAPELQRRFADEHGPIGVVDFFFPDPGGSGRGRIGEFDGDVKYFGGQFRRGRSPEQVVADEKSREDRLRALPATSGFIRWTRRDLARPGRLEELLRNGGVGRVR